MSNYYLRLLWGSDQGREADDVILMATLAHLEALDAIAVAAGHVPLSAYTDETDLVWQIEEAEYADEGESWDIDSAHWFYPKECLLTLKAILANRPALEELDAMLAPELEYLSTALAQINSGENVFHLMVEEDEEDVGSDIEDEA